MKRSDLNSSLPHQNVFPVERRNLALSMASNTPMARKSFRQLGGSDSASVGAVSSLFVKSRTAWPHADSTFAAAAPAGPPPTMTTSEVEGTRKRVIFVPEHPSKRHWGND